MLGTVREDLKGFPGRMNRLIHWGTYTYRSLSIAEMCFSKSLDQHLFRSPSSVEYRVTMKWLEMSEISKKNTNISSKKVKKNSFWNLTDQIIYTTFPQVKATKMKCAAKIKLSRNNSQ